MADQETMRRARQSLEALRGAGMEWLPRIEAPKAPARQVELPTDASEEEPAMVSDLYTEDVGIAVTPEQRRLELNKLAEVVSKCMRCGELCSTRTQTVFGVGPFDPLVRFIGEAPGADEDRQGEPFVGAAGQLLNKIIVASGFQREEVYICNILKCRPPGNRTPKSEEAANCREFLDKQLALVRPKYIVALGACAAQNLLGTTIAIGKLRGRFHDLKGITVLATYHPAFLLRDPNRKKDVWDDMKMLLQKMGRPIPGEK